MPISIWSTARNGSLATISHGEICFYVLPIHYYNKNITRLLATHAILLVPHLNYFSFFFIVIVSAGFSFCLSSHEISRSLFMHLFLLYFTFMIRRAILFSLVMIPSVIIRGDFVILGLESIDDENE